MGQISFAVRNSRVAALKRDFSCVMCEGLLFSLVENQCVVSFWGANEGVDKSNPAPSSACLPNVADRVERCDPKATVKEGLAEDSSKPHAEAVGVLPTDRSCSFYSSCLVACLCCSSYRNCKWCVSRDSSARSVSVLVITMPNEAEVKLISS